jgi:hypothetical protein
VWKKVKFGWQSILRPVSRPVFLSLLGVYLLVRVFLGTLPGYIHDVGSFKHWAIGSALYGLPAAYEKTGIDYPPLILYFLYPAGKLYIWSQPELRTAEYRRTEWGAYLFYTKDGRIYRSDWGLRSDLPEVELPSCPLPGSKLLTFFVKAIYIPFDLLVALLLYWLVSAGNLWGESRAGPGWGRLVALLYLWNPVVLWGSGYWGESDSIFCTFAIASVAMLAFDRKTYSGMLLAAAGLMKPLAVPLVPLLVAVTWIRHRSRGLMLAALGGVAAAALVFLPFVVTGHASVMLRRIISDVDIMPFTSCNAHNLWWLTGYYWQDANVPVVGPLTSKIIGLILFGTAYVLLLVRSRGWIAAGGKDSSAYHAGIFLLAAAAATTFFFVTTHLHEHHLYMTVPLLLAIAGRDRKLAWLATGCTAACFANMVMHDPALPYRLPLGLNALSPVMHPFMQYPFTWLQLAGSYVNCGLVVTVAVLTYLAAWRMTGIYRK